MGVAALVAAGAQFPVLGGGVGAAGVPPLAQVGLVLIQDAGPSAGSVADQQLVRTGGAGEPADRVAGQAELGGDSTAAGVVGE